ncbi:MAG: hypothetical protein BIFFINMI_01868 [Phycisphaerae bacterium]|nr:hypothetical protein [Phycisphaerae bacterium]
MELMIAIGHWLAEIMDYVLGWMLYLPHKFGLPENVARDIVITIVAVGTSIILTYARKWTTDQDLMKRTKLDLKRLKELKREAKQEGDKDAKKRNVQTVGMINITRMKAEGWGLLASLLPILLLASWAFERLDYFPPKVGDEVVVRATFPPGEISQTTQVVCTPQDAVDIRAVPEPAMPDDVWNRIATDTPVSALPQSRRLMIGKDDMINVLTGEREPGAAATGLGVWKMKILKPADHITLTFRYSDGGTMRSLEHPVRAGGWKYDNPMVIHPEEAGDQMTFVEHRRAGYLNYIPGMKAFWRWWDRESNAAPPEPGERFGQKMANFFWHWPVWIVLRVTLLAPWIMAYLVIASVFVPLTRKWLGVY